MIKNVGFFGVYCLMLTASSVSIHAVERTNLVQRTQIEQNRINKDFERAVGKGDPDAEKLATVQRCLDLGVTNNNFYLPMLTSTPPVFDIILNHCSRKNNSVYTQLESVYTQPVIDEVLCNLNHSLEEKMMLILNCDYGKNKTKPSHEAILRVIQATTNRLNETTNIVGNPVAIDIDVSNFYHLIKIAEFDWYRKIETPEEKISAFNPELIESIRSSVNNRALFQANNLLHSVTEKIIANSRVEGISEEKLEFYQNFINIVANNLYMKGDPKTDKTIALILEHCTPDRNHPNHNPRIQLNQDFLEKLFPQILGSDNIKHSVPVEILESKQIAPLYKQFKAKDQKTKKIKNIVYLKIGSAFSLIAEFLNDQVVPISRLKRDYFEVVNNAVKKLIPPAVENQPIVEHVAAVLDNDIIENQPIITINIPAAQHNSLFDEIKDNTAVENFSTIAELPEEFKELPIKTSKKHNIEDNF